MVEPQFVEALGQRIGRLGVSLEECLFRDPLDERVTERESCIQEVVDNKGGRPGLHEIQDSKWGP